MLGLGNSIIHGGVTEEVPFPLTVSSSSIQLWLRSGVGQTAAQWDDSSGNDNHAAQSVSGDQPTPNTVNGLGAMQFQESQGDHMDLTEPITADTRAGLNIFIVMQLASVTQNSIFGRTGQTQDFLEVQSHKQLRFTFDDTTAEKIIYADNALGNASSPFKALYHFERTSGANSGSGTNAFIKTRIDGSALAISSYPSGSDGYDDGAVTIDAIGSRNNDRFLDANVFDVLIYRNNTGSMSAGDITGIENYLIDFHGL